MASRITELAALISTTTAKINDYLQAHHLPLPSFDVDGPVELGLPQELDKARTIAIEASSELQDLLQGPAACLRPVVNGTALQAISRLDIASKLPVKGEMTFSQLADLCGVPTLELRRILRFAMAHHRVFQEPRNGYVAHTAASRMLAEDHLSRDALWLMFEACLPSFARTVDALERYKSQLPNETGFSLAHNTDLSMYDYLASQPAMAKRFSGAMEAFTSRAGHSSSFLVNGFPWAALDKGTVVVDLGGSQGHVSIALAQIFPDLRFVVQDREEVLKGAEDRVPSAVADRITFMAHNFLKQQSVKAGVYLFRWIFHNWPDKSVVDILRQLIPVLQPGSRVIINDGINPEPRTLNLLGEKRIRAVDMIMLTLFNSRERERDEWKDIFKQVDPRFTSVKVWLPEGAALAIVEAFWGG